MMSRIKAVARYGMALFYIAAGVNHFRDPGFYLDIVPIWMPRPHELVVASGFVEVSLGVLVALPWTASLAAWGIILMLLAFLPVHVHMLLHNHLYPDVPTSFLGLRFPLQGLLILWAFWFTDQRPPGSRQDRPASRIDPSAATDGGTAEARPRRAASD